MWAACLILQDTGLHLHCPKLRHFLGNGDKFVKKSIRLTDSASGYPASGKFSMIETPHTGHKQTHNCQTPGLFTQLSPIQMPSGSVPPPTGCSPKGRSTVGKQGAIFRLGLGFLLAQPPLTKLPVQCGTHTPCSAATPSPPSASASAPRRPGCESRGCCPLAEPSPCWGRGVPPLTRPVPSRAAPGELRSLCPLS